MSNVIYSSHKQPRIATLSHDYKVIFLDITNISQASQMLLYIWLRSLSACVFWRRADRENIIKSKSKIQSAAKMLHLVLNSQKIKSTVVWFIVLYLNVLEWLENKLQYINTKYKVQSVRTWFETARGTHVNLYLYLLADWSPWTLSSWNGCMRKSMSSRWSPKQTPSPQRNANSSRNRSVVSPAAHHCRKKNIQERFFLFHCGHRYLGRDVHPEANPNKVEPLWCYSCLCDDVWKVFCKLFICINT